MTTRKACYLSKILPIPVSVSPYLSSRKYLSPATANDISKGSFGIQKVRTTFAGAHGILTAAAYLRAGMMRSRDNGRSFSFRGHDSEDASILANILGVTQEVGCTQTSKKNLCVLIDWFRPSTTVD
jgi:hypothetical protein